MNMKENILLASLDERWGKYCEELKRCKEEFSEEAVHDLRVATRRLVAAMDMLRILDPHPRVQKVRRVLKGQLDSLDELRDTQVMLVEVSESMSDFPELKPFGEYLLTREKKLLRRARKEIKALHIAELKKRIEKSHESLEEKAGEEDWTANPLSAVDQAYARAKQAFGEIDAAQPASIHRFRVSFKKFRYMVETVNPILENAPAEYLKQLHDYQSHMGDIQDAAVLLNALTEYTEETDSGAALLTARKAFETRRAELVAQFMEGKDALRNFWRNSPEAKFVWETEHEPVHHSSRHRRGGGHARVRRGSSATVDRQGQEENAKDRERFEGVGGEVGSDSDQPVSARTGDSADSAQDI